MIIRRNYFRNRLEKTDIHELYKIDSATGLNIDEVKELLQGCDIDLK